MKHRFKEKCDICQTWQNEYQSYKGKMIVCDRCMKEKQGKFELEEPVNVTIYEELERLENED